MPFVLEFSRDGATHLLGSWCDEAADLAGELFRRRLAAIHAGEVRCDSLTLWQTAGDGTRLFPLARWVDPQLLGEDDLEMSRRVPGELAT